MLKTAVEDVLRQVNVMSHPQADEQRQLIQSRNELSSSEAKASIDQQAQTNATSMDD
jgi:hypothetical protein